MNVRQNLSKFILVVFFSFGISSLAQGSAVQLDLQGEIGNFLNPQIFKKNPRWINIIIDEIEHNPDLPIAKEYQAMETVAQALYKDYQKNPDLWEETEYWMTYSDAVDRVRGQGTVGTYGAYEQIRNALTGNIDGMRDSFFSGNFSLKEQLHHFIPYLFKGTNYDADNSRIIQWGVEFPIIIDGKAYMANLVGYPQVMDKWNVSNSNLFFRATLSVPNFSASKGDRGKIFIFNDPFSLFEAENTVDPKCLKPSEKNALHVSTLHTSIEQLSQFEQCYKSYPEAFQGVGYTYKEREKNKSEIYPEFHELFKKEKSFVNLLVLSSQGDGFGFSNFIKLTSGYTFNHDSKRPDGSSNSKPGDFKKIFESNGSEIKKYHSGFPTVDGRFVVLESQPFGALKQKFRIHLVYQETDYDSVYEKLAPRMDFVIYQGHSGYGYNLASVVNIPYKEKTYQSMFVLACSSMNYVSLVYRIAKGLLDFDANGTYWDFIGSSNGSPLWRSEEVLEAYIDFYFNAFKDHHGGKSLRKYSYGKLLDDMNKADNYTSDWRAAGIQQNHWQPGIDVAPLKTLGRSEDKLEGLLMAFQILVSTEDYMLVGSINERLKDRSYVSEKEFNAALQDYLESSFNDDDNKNLLKKRLGL